MHRFVTWMIVCMVLYGHKDKNYFLHFQISSLLFAQKVINKIFLGGARKKQSHCKDNRPPILHCIWIGPELEVNWTWIGAATILQWKRDELKMWFSDEVFHHHKTKKVFLHFSCHLSHSLNIRQLSGDRYFFICHLSVTKESSTKKVTTCVGWQVGDKSEYSCHHLTYWKSDSVAGDRKFKKKISFAWWFFFLELNVKHVHGGKNLP